MIIKVFRHSPVSPWSYPLLDNYQHTLAHEILANNRQGEIIFSEVSPTITLGKRANESSDLIYSREKLAELNIDVYPCSRGGFATYHGPGQWVVFVVEKIVTLTGDRKGVRKWVDLLLITVLGSLKKLGLANVVMKNAENLGLWVNDKKIASLGIAIEQGVVLHGLALNVWRDSKSFYGLNPCRLGVEKIGFLEEFLSLSKTPCEKDAFFNKIKDQLSSDLKLAIDLKKCI